MYGVMIIDFLTKSHGAHSSLIIRGYLSAVHIIMIVAQLKTYPSVQEPASNSYVTPGGSYKLGK
jgi:hypothetical protein